PVATAVRGPARRGRHGCRLRPLLPADLPGRSDADVGRHLHHPRGGRGRGRARARRDVSPAPPDRRRADRDRDRLPPRRRAPVEGTPVRDRVTLAERARAWGVELGYLDAFGTWQDSPRDTVAAILEAMGATSDVPPHDAGPQAAGAEPCLPPARTPAWGWAAQLYGARS